VKDILMGIIAARDHYTGQMNMKAEEASRLFREAADFLIENDIREEFVITKYIDLGNTLEDGELPAECGIAWAGGKFGYYFSEIVDHNTPMGSLPNILGESREIRIDAAKMLPDLLKKIRDHYKFMAEGL
jgi:hypothetical protein